MSQVAYATFHTLVSSFHERMIEMFDHIVNDVCWGPPRFTPKIQSSKWWSIWSSVDPRSHSSLMSIWVSERHVLCMYVRMHMHVCMHVRVYVHMCVYMQVCVYVKIPTRLGVFYKKRPSLCRSYAHFCQHIEYMYITGICVGVCVCVYVCMCAHARVHACTCVCSYVCMCSCVRT